MRTLAVCLAALASVGVAHAGPPPLPAFNIIPGSLTVSGVSSGGYMASQFHVAHSAAVAGAAVIAGGPYYCAGGDYPANLVRAFNVCMDAPDLAPYLGPPDVDRLLEETRERAADGSIDDPSHMTGDRVFLFSGADDDLVPEDVVTSVREYYAAFLPPAQITAVTDVPTAHAFVTVDWGNACDAFETPYINACGYDMAGEILRQLYGDLRPAAAETPGLRIFDQSPFTDDLAAAGLAEEGYVYVPAACAAGDPCRVHVALHGCLQNANAVGDAFVAHAGYNRWAESNDIVVLYPQTAASTESVAGIDVPWPNPAGCWDWWGYTGDNYYLKSAPQIRAVMAMVQALSSTP